MSNTQYFTLHNVVIPLRLDDRFISPDLEVALAYYPKFAQRSPVAMTPQEYLLAILKEIDRVKPNGHTGDQTFQHFVQHVGYIRLAELLQVDLNDKDRDIMRTASLADYLSSMEK